MSAHPDHDAGTCNAVLCLHVDHAAAFTARMLAGLGDVGESFDRRPHGFWEADQRRIEAELDRRDDYDPDAADDAADRYFGRNER